MADPKSWSTIAVNLAEHADNIIHTDAGAQAAGYDAALVAGVTTYAYLTHVPATAWGLDWLVRGGASMRFVRPVVDGDAVECAVGEADTDPCIVEARVADIVHATAEFTRHATQIDQRSGDELEPIEFVIDASWADYGQRAGDDCPLYSRHGIAHPTSWPRIANSFFHEQIVSGPWIHVRSRISHHGTASIGSTIRATANIVSRFDSRAGKRAIIDVRINADSQLVATLEHEAIIELG